MQPNAIPIPQSERDSVDASHRTLLYVENVTVSFDGFKALDDLSLYVDKGSLHCIIGPNGAGKTTLLDIITGRTRPDTGSVYFGQRIELTGRSEAQIAELGVGRKFQRPTVFENHTVFENLELALKTDKGVWHSLFGGLTDPDRARIAEIAEMIGLQDLVKQHAGLLSHGQKQWLEIGMLLMQAPRLLLVDEPVAGMTPREVDRTARLLKALAGEHTVVVVEHDMAFVHAIAERVSVLHEGRLLAEGNMETVRNDPRVIEVYLGE
ncbi:MAG: urea ABC transporter ATP-binding protein UrtD [Thermodesulfobacteriota bacterium]